MGLFLFDSLYFTGKCAKVVSLPFLTYLLDEEMRTGIIQIP